MFLVVSCDKDYPPTGEPQADQTVTIAQSSVRMLFDDSEQQHIDIQAEDGVAWRVESSQKWLTLSTKHMGLGYSFASGRGSMSVYLTAEAYDGGSGDAREAMIYVDGTDKAVVVKQYPSGDITVSLPSITFGEEASDEPRTISVDVKDNTKEWTLSAVDAISGDEIDWVTFATSRSGITATGAQEVSVGVLVNDGAARAANVMLDGDVLFAVRQTDAPFVSLTGFSASESLAIEETLSQSIGATFTPSTATDKYVCYTSSDESVATVDANGMITALKSGTATITATAGDSTSGEVLSNECSVTVEAATPVSGVSIEQGETTTIKTGDTTTQFKATVTPAGATNQSVTWTSSNTAVATIDATTGVINALTAGTTTITATTAEGGFTDTCEVTVEQSVTGITISGTGVTNNAVTLSLSGTLDLTAAITPDNASNKVFAWSEEDTNDCISYIENEDGSITLTADKEGSATIVVTSNEDSSIKDKITITIQAKELTNIAIADVSLPLTKTAQLSTTYTPSDASYKDVRYTYESGDEGKIEISEEGVVSFPATSTAAENDVITVTATSTSYQAVTCTFDVTITAAPKSYELGDIYYDGETPIGIVYWLEPGDSSKGMVFSYDVVKDEEATGVKVDYTASETLVQTFDAATMLEWSIPTLDEYKVLIVATSKGDMSWTDNTLNGYAKTNLYVSETYFNATEGPLTDDNQLSQGGIYWLSTKDDDSKQLTFNGAKGTIINTTKTALVRPVAKFGY